MNNPRSAGPVPHGASRSTSIVALALVSAAALAVAPRVAGACTSDVPVPPCHRVVVGFAADATLPANVSALPFYAPNADTAGVELRTAAGEPVPTSVGRDPRWGTTWLVPSSALVAGTRYEVRYLETCIDGTVVTGAGTPGAVGFVAGPATPLPATIGTASVETAVATAPFPAIDTCAHPVEVRSATARIRIEPSAELRAYLPVARLSATVVDGDGSGSFGYTDPGEPLVLRGLAAACESSTIAVTRGLAPGRHTVEIVASIAGVTAPPAPLRVEIDFACGGPTAPADAGTTMDGGTAPPRAPGMACSVARGDTGNGRAFAFAVPGMLGAAGLIASRRRRRRAAR